MNSRSIFAFLLLFLALTTFGCAGMSNYQTAGAGGSRMNDCNGDVPSPYPPYCHPVHD